jgi:AraC-like DNA-binding protein
MAEPTAAAFYLRYLMEGAAALGAQASGLAALAALDGDAQRVDCRALDAALQALTLHLPADCTLELGERVTPKALDILALASMSCATLEEALGLLCQFETYRLGAFRCELLHEGAHLAVVLSPLLDDLSTTALQVETAFAGWVTVGRWLTQAHQNPLGVEFSHAQRLPETRYEQTFRCPVRFGAARNAVLVSPAQWALPLATSNATVSRLTREQLQATVTDYLQGDTWRTAVRQQVLELLPHGEPTLEQVAQHLAVSVDEVARRLRGQGLGFGELLDGERKRLASLYVQSAQHALADVAQLLGYSEQSAFNRAFRRWYGVAPGEYRRSTDSVPSNGVSRR